MKKLLVSILAVMYLGTSLGATVNLHYCMGRLVNWDFSNQHSRHCQKCGMKKVNAQKKGCCQDKYKLLQVEKDQRAASAFHVDQPVAIPVTTVYAVVTFAPVAALHEEHPVCNAPPLVQVPARIRYCTFRI